MVGSVSAKTESTTLWEGTEVSSVGNDKFGAAAVGDIIRFTLTNESGTHFKVVYKYESDGWQYHDFTGVNYSSNHYTEWINGGVTTYDVTINDADLTSLQAYGMVLEDATCITKIELIHSLTPSSTTNISTESYNADWDGKLYGPVETAKIGDVIQFTFTATGTYFQMYVMNHGLGTTFKNDAYSVTNGETYTYEYVIPDYETLKKIKTEGFGIKGADFSITSVDLLTYSDSYGYVTITIGDTGYATWSSAEKYDFKSAGLQAYYASAVAPGSVTLTPMDITWDWQGYIIKGEKGDYDVMQSLTTDGTSYYPGTNYLKQNISEGTVAASTTTKYHYIFAKKKDTGEVGFYKLTADHTLGAHKAYLETDTDRTPEGGAQVALIFDDGETTSIDAINTQHPTSNTQCYNLAGQKVSDSYKGIVIKNGKKYINK